MATVPTADKVRYNIDFKGVKMLATFPTKVNTHMQAHLRLQLLS